MFFDCLFILIPSASVSCSVGIRATLRPMPQIRSTSSAKDRLLLAGAHLLEESSGDEISTRGILELAGVQAPTLYHHFDSKQGLLDAVVSHGFRQFLKVRSSLGVPADDPIADIREGWDRHVLFGLEHPNFYTHVTATCSRANHAA